VKPRALPETVRGRYRLKPDRRLLAAVAEVARLVDGTELSPATAQLEANRWRILAGDQELGELSAFPGFEESTDLLVRHAQRLRSRSPRPAAEPTSGGRAAALDRLRRSLDELDLAAILSAVSNLETPAPIAPADDPTIRAMVASLAWLAVSTPDELEQSDALLATAWAWLALERALDIRGNEGSEALLIWALGYEAAAARVSTALPSDDPIRLFVTGQEAALGRLGARSPENASVHFLRLALLTERGPIGRYRAALRESPFHGPATLALLGQEVHLRDPALGPKPGHDLAAAAFGEAHACASGEAGAAVSDSTAVEGRTRDLEAAVARCSTRFRATPLGAPAVAAIYRSAFYSGLYGEARFPLRHLASGPASLGFAARIAEPAAGTASELRHWLEARGAVVGGSPEVLPLVELLESAPSLGSVLLHDLAATIAGYVPTTDPLRRRAIPALFERLDTRPRHRTVAARVADRNLNSPWLFETFARSAAEAAPHRSEELPALVAQLREEVGRLREIAEDPAMPRYAQIVAVDALSRLDQVDDDYVRSRYEQMAVDSAERISPLVAFLEERGDLAAAYAAVAAALDRDRDPGSLGWAYLRSEAARLKRRLGDAEAAWRMVEPALATGKEDALLEGAAVQLALGRPERALELAQTSLWRYPDRSYEASALLARARWRLGDYTIAARELAASRNGIVEPWNRFLPEAFTASFAEAPPADTERAFGELIAAGIAPNVLADVAIAFGKEGELATALRLLDRLPRFAPEWTVKIRLGVYDLVREKSGDDAANAWFRSHHTRTHDDALTLYQLRSYEQLLALFPNGDEGQSPSIVRVVKAAALLHLGETEGPRREGLAKEVEGDWGRKDFFVRAARFLLDQTDETPLLESVPDVDHLASVGWAMGIKAASERRFVDADGWFQVALESGQQQSPPHAWAWQIESDWMQSHRSLELLEKKGQF
jgi:tetratricopeptide (TPR) repeat protein